jgi:hypothetical protein
VSLASRPRSSFNRNDSVVIVRDRPGSVRTPSNLSTFSALQAQTFAGEILDASSTHAKDIGVKGNVFGCLARCTEDIEAQLGKHPYATNIWDMSTVTIWPMETVHTSAYRGPPPKHVEGPGDLKL